MSLLQSFLEILKMPEFYQDLVFTTGPILLAALGCAVAEKASATNMGMEGIMMISSLMAVFASAATQNVWVGLLTGIVTGTILGLAVAYFTYNLRVDIILVGIALNMIGTGGSIFLMFVATGDRSATTSLVSGLLPFIEIPLIKDIPFIGKVLSGQNLLTYVAYALIFVLTFFLFKTKLGLRIRAVGENASACESVGISSIKIKTIALAISGAIGGIGGAYMSMAYLSYFAANITAGRGFIGLAACAMGNANPIPVGITSLLFGFFWALANYGATTSVSTYILTMLPYIATIVGLVIFSIRETKKALARLAGKDQSNGKDAPKKVEEKGRTYINN